MINDGEIVTAGFVAERTGQIAFADAAAQDTDADQMAEKYAWQRPHHTIIAGQKRGLAPTMRREQQRRKGIEAVIDHAQFDYRMERNHLLGTIGDATNVLAAACGYSLRRIPNAIRRLWALIILMITSGTAKFDT